MNFLSFFVGAMDWLVTVLAFLLMVGIAGKSARATQPLSCGQREQEPGAVVQFALGADGAAVRQHDVLGNG